MRSYQPHGELDDYRQAECRKENNWVAQAIALARHACAGCVSRQRSREAVPGRAGIAERFGRLPGFDRLRAVTVVRYREFQSASFPGTSIRQRPLQRSLGSASDGPSRVIASSSSEVLFRRSGGAALQDRMSCGYFLERNVRIFVPTSVCVYASSMRGDQVQP